MSTIKREMAIYTTETYSVFKSHKQNRKINERSVSKMEDSIRKYGLIQPIVVSSDGYIIDGQHRLSACMRLGKPVTYVVNYNIDSKAVMEANNTQRKWTADDWVRHYDKLGNVDYRLLSDKVKEWSKIFTSGKVRDAYSSKNGSSNALIKKGEYTIDVKTGDTLLQNCVLMKNVCADAYHTRFVRALKTIMLNNDNFDINELIKKFSQKKFNFYYNEQDVVKELIEVYNYKRNKNKIS